MSTEVGAIHYDLDLDKGQFDKKLSAADKDARKFTDTTSAGMENVNRGGRAMAVGIGLATGALVAGAAALGGLSVNAVQAAANMETMRTAVLSSFQGDAQAATDALNTIKEFAKTTPYSMEQALTGFLRLKNLGLTPSIEALRSYGNTASSMGKGLNDMVEAVADATTGEFIRLREFGIKASTQGDQVAFTFQGVTKTVKNNAADIENYLMAIGNTQFSGAMDKQALTLSGRISTLKDDFNLAMVEIAEKSGLFDVAKRGVEGLSASIPTISRNIIAFAQAVTTTAQTVQTYIQAISQTFTALGAAMAPVINAVWAFLLPGLQALWTTINTELLPSLQRLWQVLSPVLLPVIQFLAVGIGVALVASLWLLIQVVNGAISSIASFANWISDVVGRVQWMGSVVVGTFTWMRDAIAGVMSYVYQGITDPFRRAFEFVKNGVDAVVNKLKDLNPFQRHSPSLVDMVTAGTTEIEKQYGGLYDSLRKMAGGFTATDMTGGLAGLGAGGTSSSFVQNNNIYETVDMVAANRELNYDALRRT